MADFGLPAPNQEFEIMAQMIDCFLEFNEAEGYYEMRFYIHDNDGNFYYETHRMEITGIQFTSNIGAGSQTHKIEFMSPDFPVPQSIELINNHGNRTLVYTNNTAFFTVELTEDLYNDIRNDPTFAGLFEAPAVAALPAAAEIEAHPALPNVVPDAGVALPNAEIEAPNVNSNSNSNSNNGANEPYEPNMPASRRRKSRRVTRKRKQQRRRKTTRRT